MSFSGILGQSRAIGLIRQAMARDQIPHAYLFTGIRGVGKTSTARAMAMHLSCTGETRINGCGTCAACRKILGGNHPDLLFIQPEGANIRIEQIRDLNRKLAFAPASAPYRITVLQRAEAMSPEAANAFLKTLEEPPPRNVMILQAIEPGNLLPTIVSRCQRIAFQPLEPGVIAEWLVERHETARETAEIAAALCGGSPGKAWKIVSGSFLEKRRSWLLGLLEMPSGREEDTFSLAADCAREDTKAHMEISDEGQPGLQDLLSVWESWYRDLMAVKAGAASALLVNRDFSRQLQKSADQFNFTGLTDSVFRLDRARRDILRNRNAGVVLSHLLLGLWKISAASPT